MNANITRNLPQFHMFNDFFARLGGTFEPIALPQEEKRKYVRALQMLGGSPAHHFRQLREDFDLTAQVRDVRSYGEGKTYVRFDFRRMESSGKFGAPIQLMALFDDDENIVAYTVLRDRGNMEDGVIFAMTNSGWGHFETTQDVRTVLSFLEREPHGEVGIKDVEHDHPFMYVFAGKGPGGWRYDIEWYLSCEPWLLTVKCVDVACVEQVVRALLQGGIRAVEDAVDWQQFDFIRNYSEDGVLFEIDLELHRDLERAKRNGDKMVEESIRAVGISEEQTDEPYTVRVKYGRQFLMWARLLEDSCPEADGDKMKEILKARCTAYLAVRNQMEGMHNFGWRFHFGCGVPVDYEKAVYWHEKAAAMGDAHAMQNLGAIYSEKNSPVHDCVKAAAWYEKAIAAGDTFAMGQRAHCLLCGQNGKDVARALDLAKKACVADPDNQEFRETYEEALRASEEECN